MPQFTQLEGGAGTGRRPTSASGFAQFPAQQSSVNAVAAVITAHR